MNPQIRKLWQIIMVMFLLLGISTTYIQFICTTNLLGSDYNLTNNQYNSRGTQRAKYVERGPIFVGEKRIVSSIADPSSQGYRKRYQRQYTPESTQYAHLIGYLAPSGGGFGMELLNNSTLMGENGANIFARTFDTLTGKRVQGSGIRLTIDPRMQQAAWEALQGKKGAAVAINYQTGAILASVSNPSYDLSKLANTNGKESQTLRENLEKNDPSKPLLNRALEANYFPGSAFKLITAAVGLERLNLSPTSRVDAPTFLPFPQNKRAGISNIEGSECGDGHPTLEEAFARSCNTPFAAIGRDAGHAALLEKAEAFGFNAKEPLRVPLRVVNSQFPKTDPGDYLLQLAIGQHSVQTNPLLMATIAGAIANDGKQITPYLLAEITNPDGKAIRTFKGGKEMGHPLKKEIADQLKKMMRSTVTESFGTAHRANIDGIEMGGKTGTAQTGHSGYTDAWFVGYALPNNQPIAFAVVVEGDENNPDPHGGPVAGPVAKKMIQAVMKNG